MSLDATAVALPLINALRRSLERASVLTSHRRIFQDFLTCVGWDVPITDGDLQTIRNFMNVEGPLNTFSTIAENLESNSANQVQLLAQLLGGVISLIETIKKWGNANVGSLPPPFNGTTSFWTDFPEDMLNHLVAQSLDAEVPTLSRLLVLFGILDKEVVAPAGAQRVPFVRQRVHWDQLGTMITDPIGQLRASFRWNQPGQNFDDTKFLYALGFFLESAGFPGRLSDPDPGLLDIYYSPGNSARNRVKALHAPFLLEVDQGFTSFAEVGLTVLPITPAGDMGGQPNGFAILPLARGAVQGSLDPQAEWRLALTGDALLDGAFRMEVRPDGAGLVLAPGSSALEVGLSLQGRFHKPLILIGAERSHRVEVEGVLLAVEIKGTPGDPDVILKVGTGEGSNAGRIRFIFQAGEGDGFIQKIAGSEAQSLDLSGYVSFSRKNGLGINGNIGFELQIPLHLAVGPVEFQALQLGTRANDSGGINLPLGLNLKAALGPVTAVVENIGVEMVLTALRTDQKAGLLGNLDVDWKFKPPNGVGLVVDAGVVKGGGYLFFDFDKEEYAGALELMFSGIVSLKAIGLLTTRMPDGSKGFSLLIIITAEFGTGIQLGFGFILLGVGGLLGLNRTVRLEQLAEGVRTGAVNNIMFPQDVVANAPRIISDLRTIFPPEQGKFLIGPMAKLGWGTPTLISLSLGIIIEIPGNLAILGVLRCILPTEDAAILVLQVAFVGAIEFDKKRLWLFAGLFESRVLFITLEGEMGVLAAFGDDANFVISVGGFHPRFTPPPLPFPVPNRLALDLLNEPGERIRIEGYFAVTTNTVQFGAHAELVFGFDDFGLHGHLGFDALFQFSPFYFIIQIGADLSLDAFGLGLFSVDLDFSLEGPTPYRAHGRGSISLFFFDISADFDITWGESRDTTLPPIDIMPQLTAEFDKLENWKAFLPANANLLVSLRHLDATGDGLVVHPLGTLRISQRYAPLDSNIDKVGTQKPRDAKHFNLQVTSADLVKTIDVPELFAPAQFHDMSNADKLSKPAYVPEHGGLELSASGQQLNSSQVTKRIARYEQIIIDTNFKRFAKKFRKYSGVLFEHFLKGNAISKSTLSVKYKQQMQPFKETIKAGMDSFAVAFTDNNKAYKGEAVFTSVFAAQDYMAQAITTDPALTDSLHVIPHAEVNRTTA
jgi:hypothetical protein